MEKLLYILKFFDHNTLTYIKKPDKCSREAEEVIIQIYKLHLFTSFKYQTVTL